MNTKRITGNVSDVLPDSKIIINRGQKDGVEPGQTYQIYRVGEMLTDPKTGESLGALESTCGYGTVEQVQPEEATLTLEAVPFKIDTDCRVRRVVYIIPLKFWNKFWNKGAENNKAVVYRYKSIIVKERSDSFINSSRLIKNAAARLPILFCLDVSASMAVCRDKANRPPITLLNEAVKQLLDQLRDELPMAEVAFLTFSEWAVDYVPFQSLSDLLDLEFHVVADQNGTRLAYAVRKSIEKIEERREELKRMMVENYAPFLIVVTDGDEGDKKQADIEQAQEALYAHTRSHAGERTLIVPFIIGVGEDVGLDKLRGYSKGFEEGAFRLKNRAQIQVFRAIFRIVGDSIGSSIDLNADRDDFLDILGNRVREEISRAELSEKIRDMWNHFIGDDE